MRKSNFCTCFTSAWNVKASTTSHPFPLCSTHRANGVCVHSTCHFQLTDTWNSHFVLTQKNFLIKRFAELACASLCLLIMIYHFMKCGNNKLRNIQETPLPRRQRGGFHFSVTLSVPSLSIQLISALRFAILCIILRLCIP